jgi:hypothetical protein
MAMRGGRLHLWFMSQKGLWCFALINYTSQRGQKRFGKGVQEIFVHKITASSVERWGPSVCHLER